MLPILTIYGVVSHSTAVRLVAGLEKLATEDPDQVITMKINSPGGSIPAMMAIRDAMLRVPNPIRTIVHGRAASAASFLAAHGTKGLRYAYPNAQFMYHEPNGMAEKTTEGLYAHNYYKEVTTKILADLGDISIAKMEEMIDRDWYIQATDLVTHQANFLDRIVGL